MPGAAVRYSATGLARLIGQPAPTEEQTAVIEAPLAPGVVIAGAGSGKTETMASRVVWLVANELVSPERVLGLTFTRKAAGELQQRIRRRLRTLYAVLADERPGAGPPPDATGEPTVLTYAAYAGRLVDEHGIVLGHEPGARLLTEAARWQVADAVVRGYSGEFSVVPGVIATVTERVLDLAGQLADHLSTPAEVSALSQRLRAEIELMQVKPSARTRAYPAIVEKLLESLAKRDDLLPLVEAFAARKRADGLLDFSDHMVLASQLAEHPAVVGVERSRYDVVLLDEYQDTGYAQIQMLAGLFADGRAVTAVGDPLQSIYSWRGASAGNIDRFADRFRTRDGDPAVVFGLMTSWRNDRRILNVANKVAGPLRLRPGTALAERPGAEEGAVRVSYSETVRTEAQWIAEQLRTEWDARTDWTKSQRTLAVLVRKRSGIGLIAQAIRQQGLPVEVVDIGGLLTLPEVADVRAVLTVLTDHNAGGSLRRLLTGARWRIGPADLVALHDYARVQARRTSGAIGLYLRTAAAGAAPAGAAANALTTADGGALGPADGDPETVNAAADRDERIEPSLIEALDDLTEGGATARFSVEGLRRLRECAALLRRLRRRLELPLPDLIAEIESALGLDVEVAARPGTGYSALAGRANLDRFADEAARFVADRGGSSITAFLGYLKAAENEEYGLKPATVEVTPDRVQVLTVHGAKGLEWDVVAVAGLVTDGFPDQPKSHDWTTAPALLPAPLRGDGDQLPGFDFSGCQHRGEAEDCLTAHHTELGRRHLAEERRLAYVAFTRARKTLLCSGAAWGSGSKARTPSVFLEDLRADPGVQLEQWHQPDPQDTNPLEDETIALSWPFDPLGERREPVERAAAQVLSELVALRPGAPAGRSGSASAVAGAEAVSGVIATVPDRCGPGERAGADPTLAQQWARDVDLLLAERAASAGTGVIEVALPAQLSVSDVVSLSADPQALARRLRRPLPQQPAQQARRGTAFHEWLEQRWSAESLLDIEDLPGAVDELADATELQALKDAFEAGEWADATPVAVEVGFEMSFGARVVRGRMDAVFRDSDGYTVVDWKTGRIPSGEQATAQAVQLALYRLAWADLAGIPDSELHTVRAAFYYVAHGETHRPADLLDAEQLRELIKGTPAPSAPPTGAGTDSLAG
jgi:DNA helicase-2/ATP-dependent DNA helicase PcrA